MDKGKNLRNRVFLLIRTALILSIIINIFVTLAAVSHDDHVTRTELVHEISKRIEFIFWGAITFLLTFGSDLIEKRERIDIPDILEIIIVLFIYAGLFLSVRFNLYYRFFWWDDFLHILSGVIIGFLGFILIYKINHNYSMDISPLLVAVFSFSFAVTLGVLWEILEFLSDVYLGTANQKWNLPRTEILMGRPYQGSGLRDTMSDLIVDSVGAFITSVIAYYMYKYRKKKTLAEMKRMLNDDLADAAIHESVTMPKVNNKK